MRLCVVKDRFSGCRVSSRPRKDIEELPAYVSTSLGRYRRLTTKESLSRILVPPDYSFSFALDPEFTVRRHLFI